MKCDRKNQWATSEEYGYAYLIPLIVLFFVWQKKDRLANVPGFEIRGGMKGLPYVDLPQLNTADDLDELIGILDWIVEQLRKHAT